MKKLIVIAAVFLANSAFALNTGSFVISGTVLPVNDLIITPNANATSLDIINGNINLNVASVSETSNNLTGYVINMRSANASKLLHSVDPSKLTAYTVQYNGGSAVTLTTSDQVVKTVSSLAGLTTNTSDVNVNVTAYPTAVAGTYSDTITISIVAN